MTEAEGRDFSALDHFLQGAAVRHRAFRIATAPAAASPAAPDEIAGDIRSFAAIGVHELIFDFRGESIADSIERLQRFAAEVMPLVN